MICEDKSVKLMDLGLAKQIDTPVDTFTHTNEVLGTPYFMSPEQCRNDPELGGRSDLFSLGSTLFIC